MHSQFEELCALAVTGQISGDAMLLLDQHVKGCDKCRTFLQELSPLKVHVAPVLAASHVRTSEPPAGMRERFLQRAAAAGMHLQPGPVLAVADAPAVPERTFEPTVRESWVSAIDRMRTWYAAAFRIAVPVTAALLCGLLGYFVAQQRFNQAKSAIAYSPVRITMPTQVSAPSAQLAQLERERADALRRVEQMSAELAQLQAEKQRLVVRLGEAAQRASAGVQFEQQFKAEAEQLQNAEGRVAKLRADLDAERQKLTVSDAILVQQQKATQEANDKIASLQNQMDREREMNSARSGAGDMIAARNLHIVDVYDTAATGERKRPFGRVFYVEGQSLVFYAYDLESAKHANTKIAFHVWGETAGVKTATTYNLGILRADDPGQGRWKLSFDDPKILARINAVYITADPIASPKSAPSGRKLMYAFLGSPNHP